jgi:flagellar biosynthesis/type III secretory pathway protein FliH
LKQFAIFNIQLPFFPEAPKDYSNPLYRWCKLLYEMHFNKKLPTEVADMEPKMREFIENDAGAAQFVDRYGEAAASPEIQQTYWDWLMADFREQGIIQGARMLGLEEGLEKGREEGLEKGREEGREEGRDEMHEKDHLEFAKKLLKRNRPIEEIIEDTELSRERIEALRADISAEA